MVIRKSIREIKNRLYQVYGCDASSHLTLNTLSKFLINETWNIEKLMYTDDNKEIEITDIHDVKKYALNVAMYSLMIITKCNKEAK